MTLTATDSATPALRDVSLDDKYTRTQGPVLINGNQAIVRALLLQRQRDQAAGLNTAGFVSGYRGSPLGGLDQALWAAQGRLKEAAVTFMPGINEDLAATAIWGTQQLAVMGDATVDGVFGLWYGKGPGVDRSGDPLKHGNYAGTHPNGGVLVVTGDDHQGKSSTIAHHSQQALAANSIPVLYPADVSEFVPYALLGWALSRYSGCWVGFKVVNETVEQAMTCELDLDALSIERPEPRDMPPEGIHYRGTFTPAQDEVILRRWKLPLVQRFARANRIDRQTLGDANAKLGIVTAGKTWHEVRLALRALGIGEARAGAAGGDEARARALGVAVYKVGLLWPLEPEGLAEFADGKQELFFVEDKSAFVESQAAAILYNRPQRPRITGKADETGRPLLNADVGFEAIDLALVIAARLQALGAGDDELAQRVQALHASRRTLLAVMAPAEARRTPFFCSGCPHNTSTVLPEGSQGMAGIGCHGMAMFARPGTMLASQMGGEGLTWVGMSRYTRRQHVFQNLGDGTYYHSGLLAIRAAVASGANITYKILYNDAVAMTGGQPVDGPISPAEIAHQVMHEGVKKLVLVSDDPSRHSASALPAGVRIEHRDRLDAVQRELRDTPGCTVLLYEQTCAAEKRRRRKRGQFDDPDRRMFIFDEVCEGCGDCAVQSTCVSIEPKDTPLGRKRRINQSSCNKDYSCVKGFCPSFVTVQGGTPRKLKPAVSPDAAFASLPAPAEAALDGDAFGVMIPGIGGTGVITVGAVLAMAAHLEGKAASTYDMTGLSQKNGAVYSHLQIAPDVPALRTHRLGLGDASLVLGFDMVAALADESFRTLAPGRTRFIGNHRVQPTAAVAMNPDARLDFGLLARKVTDKLGADHVRYLDATGLATALMGDAIATNFFVVGAALQLGWLPVSLAAVERAIALNGMQVEFNLRALRYGRLWVHDPAAIDRVLGAARPAPVQADTPTLEALVADRVQRLTDYQNAAYAARYQSLLADVRAAERRVAGQEGAFSLAVARHFAKLMMVKDEYEVARLYDSPSFKAKLDAEFEGVTGLRFHLAPPLFAPRDPDTGELRKREYGPWMLTAMGWLARFKGLRGTAFDLFGRTEERQMERGLIDDYERRMRALLAGLDAVRLPLAVQIADVPEQIRGFGHVKERQVKLARAAWDTLDAQWRAPVTAPLAQAA
jgi:indolepyruvate ferredoxin oxidoreductase